MADRTRRFPNPYAGWSRRARFYGQFKHGRVEHDRLLPCPDDANP